MRTVSIAAVSLVLAGCGAASPGGRPSADPLDAPWLGDSSSVRAEHLRTLVDLAKNDPEATAIYGRSVHELGGSLEALAAHMSICPDGVTAEGGLTLVVAQDGLGIRTLDEVAAGRGSGTAEARLAQMKMPIRGIRRALEPDAMHFEVTLAPQICFVQRLSIGEAYETVIHELVHALDYDPRELMAMAARAPDEAAFLRGTVLAKGGEVEAYGVATRVRLRLGGGHYISPLGTVIDLGSPVPVSADALAEVILAPRPRGLGYATGILGGKYAETRQRLRESLVEQRNFYAKVLDDRKNHLDYAMKSLDISAHNVAVFEHNVEVAKARGDAGLLAESRRKGLETQAEMARHQATGALATASIARLAARLAELDARIAASP